MAAVAAALIAGAAVLTPAGPAAATPPVPDTTRFYWFGNYQIAKVWGLGATGQGITVAVLDTGVQADEPELRGVVLSGTDFAGGDGQTDTDRPNGHGSAMARYIAAQGGGRWNITGIAPGARILPVTVDNKFAAVDDGVADTRGIRYAVDHGAKVVNLSQGTAGTCPSALADAVRYALGKGAVVVASAGNQGDSSNQSLFPANCPGVLAVGAVNGNKQPWVQSQQQPYVDVAAPGVGMFNEDLAGDSGTSDGTSEAAALTSGVVALVWSKFPTLTARQVVARLLATVTDDAAHPGKDDVTGYGIVRPYNAITTAVPANAPNPVFDEVSTTSPSTGSSPGSSTGSSSGSPSASSSSSGPSASALPPGKGVQSQGPSASTSGSGNGPLIGGIVGGVVVLAVAAGVVVASRRRRPPTQPGPGPW